MEDEDFDAPDDGPPGLVESSDDEDEKPHTGATGSSPQEESPPNTRKPTSPPVEAELDCEPSTKRDTHDVGKDTRGLGLETFDGRGAVRKYKGSKRPPIDPPRNLADQHS